MSPCFRTLISNCQHVRHITKPVSWSGLHNYPIRIISSGINENKVKHRAILQSLCIRKFTSNETKPKETQTYYQRFKEMYKNYWYVVLPVHLVTSAIWFGGFYYAVRSGVDAVAILQYVGVSESIISPLKDSKAGYLAFAFALYKIATPVRYTVTLGGTAYTIRKLIAYGWIKPVPSGQRIKEILQVKTENLQDRLSESRIRCQDQLKSKHNKLMNEMKKYKKEIKNKVSQKKD